MKKEKYFKLVKKITKKLRKKGWEWNRTYSEPREGRTYRTKLYDVPVDTQNTPSQACKKMVKLINNKYGDKVVAYVYTYNEISNVIIKPIKKIKV